MKNELVKQNYLREGYDNDIIIKIALHKKRSFPIRISSVNMAKCAENFIFCAVLHENYKNKISVAALVKFKLFLNPSFYCSRVKSWPYFDRKFEGNHIKVRISSLLLCNFTFS